MQEKTTYLATAIASLVAFICILVMAVIDLGLVPELALQPSTPSGPVSEFVRATNEEPDLALGFFAADTLFVLSYLMVFVGLHAVTGERSRVYAGLGLGAGALAAVLDATENAYFINYALLAKNNVPLVEPALPLIYNLSNLKWMAAFAALYAFGLVWPRNSKLEWLISGLMLLFPVVGAASAALLELMMGPPLIFLIGMPLFVWYFWRKSGKA
jgi:hypothetical protein